MQLSGTVSTLGTLIFALAVIHTFLAARVHKMAANPGPHRHLWHLLGEVEVVFGFWSAIFLVFLALTQGPSFSVSYLESISFTEPAFVFVVMIVAASKPILALTSKIIVGLAGKLPMPLGVSICFTALTVGPLLGSFITEPAAMTVTALLLYLVYFKQPLPNTLKYAILGTLFVNISIGGVLTHFAAPPVIMSAPAWGWGLAHMASHFGWKASLAVLVNAALLVAVFARPLSRVEAHIPAGIREDIPYWVTAVHLAVLILMVALLHHPLAFLAVFVIFLGFCTAYPKHQSELMVKPALLVAVFLGGLVILGPAQRWWVMPLLERLDSLTLFWGATFLTAITDNAALTYLGTLAPDLSDASKYALLSGAVTGGGLTVIANAPNPAGYSILKAGFDGELISPLGLFLAAIVPTCVAAMAFLLLPA